MFLVRSEASFEFPFSEEISSCFRLRVEDELEFMFDLGFLLRGGAGEGDRFICLPADFLSIFLLNKPKLSEQIHPILVVNRKDLHRPMF